MGGGASVRGAKQGPEFCKKCSRLLDQSSQPPMCARCFPTITLREAVGPTSFERYLKRQGVHGNQIKHAHLTQRRAPSENLRMWTFTWGGSEPTDDASPQLTGEGGAEPTDATAGSEASVSAAARGGPQFRQILTCPDHNATAFRRNSPRRPGDLMVCGCCAGTCEICAADEATAAELSISTQTPD